jgi:triosephosphate isomerase
MVIGNWKMYGLQAEARALASAVRDGFKRKVAGTIAVCPPFTALPAVAEALAGSAIALGAQNCHPEPQGAHTGEVSVPMLAELGCRYVIVGHSERRKEIGETDEQINRKVHAVLAHGLTPVLCVGETGEERRQGLTFPTVEGQLRAGLGTLAAESVAKVVLAYEPVWAIGTGVNATPQQAAEVHGYLRGIVSELSSKETAQGISILYGGSVKADNAESLLGEQEIDGALVGGASLKAPEFIAIVRKAVAAPAVAREGTR